MIGLAANKCPDIDDRHWRCDDEPMNADRFVLDTGPNDFLSVTFSSDASEQRAFQESSKFPGELVVSRKDIGRNYFVDKSLKQRYRAKLRTEWDFAEPLYKRKWRHARPLSPKAQTLELVVARGLHGTQVELNPIPTVERQTLKTPSRKMRETIQLQHRSTTKDCPLCGPGISVATLEACKRRS